MATAESVHPGLADADLAEVAAELAGFAAEADRAGAFPADGIDAVHRAGLLTTTVGERYGGANIGATDTARILRALGEGDPSVALISAMTLFTHAGQAARPVWPEDLYAQVLGESHGKATLLNAARVEPELGSPARGGLPATTARRTASRWALSGTKRFVTGAHGLSYFLVWARTDEAETRVGTFVVPASSEGIVIGDNWNMLGLRASGSVDVEFRDVAVPLGNVIGLTDASAGAQDNQAHATLNTTLAALYLGVARAAQQEFHRFAHERVPSNLGRPLATTDRFRDLAGEIDLLLSGAENLVLGMLRRVDAGENVPATQLLGARVLAVRHLTDAVGIAVRALGNPGLSRDNALERHFRNAQSAGVHAPQEDTTLSILGRAALDFRTERP
ncbi:acyl-CoA dehydrogenase family protein [Rhodococcus jostii]|uniref:Acyl-CoA dehydrogenase n=1 Tax=Rhodococcus jostii TaxID=132919 RepID=A0A1H5HEQ2_RHOJO|nr:acyl-CoA dehydrogenase family protein [Rhodococcus jostii]SEE26285.1 Acyl-CoA dehydrogenase [Rhodococcus jostii]